MQQTPELPKEMYMGQVKNKYNLCETTYLFERSSSDVGEWDHLKENETREERVEFGGNSQDDEKEKSTKSRNGKEYGTLNAKLETNVSKPKRNDSMK